MRVFLAILLAAFATCAHAQYYNSLAGRQFNNMYAANADFLMSQMIQQSGWAAMRASVEAAANKKAGAAQPQAAPMQKKAAYKLPIAASDFKPTGPRRVPELLAEGATSPKDRQDLIVAGRQIQQGIEGTPGFRKNNVAAAMTVLLGVSIQVLNGQELSDDESDALMYGLNDELAALESFKSMPADKRTQAYDTFVIIGGFIAGIFQAGMETRNAALQEQARSMARDALAKFGVEA